jgi:hypothetical protein
MHDHSTPADDDYQDIPWADELPATANVQHTREEVLHGILSPVGNQLARAGYALYEAQSRGVTLKEAADHLQLSERFLGVLAEYAHNQLANEVWHAIECRKIAIREHEAKLEELRRERELLDAGDEGTVLSLIGRNR